MKKEQMGGECSAREGDENTNKMLVGKHEGKKPLKRYVDGKMILKWMLEKYGLRELTGFVWLRVGTGGGSCKAVINFRVL
jgi:hypothetical protein